MAAARPDPITAIASEGETVTIPPIVSATAAAKQKWTQQVEEGGHDDRLRGPRGTGSHQGRDCIRGVVEPVGHREAQSEEDRDHEPRVHSVTLWR